MPAEPAAHKVIVIRHKAKKHHHHHKHKAQGTLDPSMMALWIFFGTMAAIFVMTFSLIMAYRSYKRFKLENRRKRILLDESCGEATTTAATGVRSTLI